MCLKTRQGHFHNFHFPGSLERGLQLDFKFIVLWFFGLDSRYILIMQLIYRELEADIVRRTNAVFPAQNCFVEVLPDHLIIPRKYVELGESIRSLPVYQDDVWMVSYPRTGSTWAQEMVWLLGHKLNYVAAEQDLRLRSPLIELSALFSTDHYETVA